MLLDETKEKTDAKTAAGVELQSLVDTHQQPFVIVDSDYRILAVNKAYEENYGASRSNAVGQHCYKISHNNDAPCSESGEECPHQYLFEKGEQHSCVHLHYDQEHRVHQVRVTAYPLVSSNGALYMGEMIEDITAPEERLSEAERMVGEAPAFTACMQQLDLVAASEIPVLLQGDTGTGKELAANYTHRISSRSTRPFITVDCTVLTESLFEAEVFGHARGAYTGSVGERSGLFEQANGGTLFLDEVGELPPSQQAKLLRVLETGKFRRVGGRGTRKADVRLICASNVHLWEAVQEGRFREDLYYRIACLTIRLPSLQERLEDIPLLASALLNPVSQSLKRSLDITPDALVRLKSYDYPGNIRELRNILFVAATQSRNGKITTELVDDAMGHLNQSHGQTQRAAEKTGPAGGKQAAHGTAVAEPQDSAAASLHDIEAKHIATLLAKHRGNRKQVAAALGISERTLYRKLRKYRLT